MKIPIWCIPWQARKRIAQIEVQEAYEHKRAECSAIELAEEVRAHRETVQQKISVEMELTEAREQLKHKTRAITATTAWIFATHKIDQRASQPGLTDLLKEMPNRV